MLEPKTDQEWIDAFLLGLLSEKEIATFQQRLKKEPALSLLLEEQKILTDGLRLNRLSTQVQYFQGLNVLVEDEVKELDEVNIGEAVRVNKNLEVLKRFRERGEEMDAVVVRLPKKRRWNWQLAAGFLLPFGLSLGLWSFYLNNQLPNKYYTGFPIAGTMGNQISLEGFTLYKEGKYIEALKVLDNVKSANPSYGAAKAIQGEILFKEKDYLAAHQKFIDLLNQETLLNQQNKDFKARLEWNTALTTMKTNKKHNHFLTGILLNPKHKFHQNALLLQQQIRFNLYLKWGALIFTSIGVIGVVLWFSSRKNKSDL